MRTDFPQELRQAGVPFNGYRELAQPIQDAHNASRWPLISVTDQTLLAQRWRRDALNRQTTSTPSNVSSLPIRQPEAPQDWFGTPAVKAVAS